MIAENAPNTAHTLTAADMLIEQVTRSDPQEFFGALRNYYDAHDLVGPVTEFARAADGEPASIYFSQYSRRYIDGALLGFSETIGVASEKDASTLRDELRILATDMRNTTMIDGQKYQTKEAMQAYRKNLVDEWGYVGFVLADKETRVAVGIIAEHLTKDRKAQAGFVNGFGMAVYVTHKLCIAEKDDQQAQAKIALVADLVMRHFRT